MLFGEGPQIKNIAADLNKLFRQGSLLNQSGQTVEGDSTADQGTSDLLAARDPVIQEISVGMSGEQSARYTVSGTPPLSLHNSLGKPLKAWSVDLLPYQEGTGDPSPDNVRAIHGTDKVTVYTALESNGQYKALEYITIPQDAYINTGFTSNSETLEIRVKVQANDFSQYGPMYGNYIDENTDVIRMIWATNSGAFYFNANSKAASPVTTGVGSTIASSILTIAQTRTSVAVNGTSFTAVGSVGTNNNTPIALGALKVLPSGTSYGLKKLYYFDISDNGVTLLQLRPALRVSDNAVGMYDLVSNTFLESATSTPCTAGTELSYYYPMHIESITLPQTVYTGTIGSEGGESRWGEVDLGTLNWTYDPGNTIFYANLLDKDHSTVECNVMCEVYKQYPYNGQNISIGQLMPDLSITGLYAPASSNSWIYIKDTSYTTAASLKASLQGVKCIYQLATTTTLAAPSVTIPTPQGSATTWATAEDGTVDSMEVTYVGKA